MPSSHEHRSYGTNLPEIADPDSHDVKADDTSLSNSDDEQEPASDGVKAIEAISQAWTGQWLLIAYVGLVFLTSVVSLEQQTTSNVAPTALSSWGEHSLLATIGVVSSVMLTVAKPFMAKTSDVFGRLEAFSISVFLYVLGYIQEAAANGAAAYAGAQVFYAAGNTGIQILVQIFVADTTDLLWRAFFSSVPDIPFLWTTWVGPIIADSLINKWRWAYGMWAIILPTAFLPLFMALFLNKRKARKLGYFPKSSYRGKTALQVLQSLWFDLDVFGLLLFTAFICLILIPLTVGSSVGWGNPSIIAMFVVGGVCLITFPFWERNSKLAPKAFFPRDLFRNKNVIVGTVIAFFYFMAYYLSVYPYFFSYLQVVNHQSVAAAGHITLTFTFTSTVTSLVVSFIILYTAHYKYFITLGACIYATGIGLMIAYRTPDASVGTLVGCQIAVGIGGGMLNVPAQLGVQASVSHKQMATATAVFLTLLEVGGAVGNAISGAIWTNTLLPKLSEYLPPSTRDQASTIFGDYTIAANYKKWPLGTPTRTAINRAYQETMHTLLIPAVCVAAIIIPLSLFMDNYKLDQIDQKVKGRVIGGSKDTDGLSEQRRKHSMQGNPEVSLLPGSRAKSRWPWKKV